jgi:phosphohistidine phosphatase
MKTLLVQRHAKSSWKDPGLDDHDRPLNKRGKTDAPRMGRLVREEGLIPDLILSSTAVRAKNTAKEVAEKSRYTGKIQGDSRLYLAGPADIVTVLNEIDAPSANRVMIVGHNPGFEELVRVLTGGREAFPTAALAQVELPISTWGELELSTKGKLAHLWRPKELGD